MLSAQYRLHLKANNLQGWNRPRFSPQSPAGSPPIAGFSPIVGMARAAAAPKVAGMDAASLTTSPDTALALQWVFGGVVVLLYARDRFEHPQPMRATTTFWRYWSAWCGYIAAMLALFVVLGGGITAVKTQQLLSLVNLVGGDAAGPDALKSAAVLPGPLLSALVLTSLLPHFPLLGRIDDAVKKWFQRVGNMPIEVRMLSARLAAAAYELPPQAAERLRPGLRAFGVDAAWLREAPDTVRNRWARCVALLAQVQHWEEERSYARYVDENKAALNEIRTRMATLADLLDAQALAELDHDGATPLLLHVRKGVLRDLAQAQRALHDFVSGGVLSGGRSHAQRRAALARLGFSGLPATREPLNAHDIVLVMGIVFLAMLFVPLMMRRFFYAQPLDANLRVLVMVPMIYAIAIVLAVYPKSMWPAASRQSAERRPVAAYALSGALAALAAFAVSLLFRFAFDQHGNVVQALATPDAFVKAWGVTIQRWPWLLQTFFVTVAIAWAADDHLPAGAPAPRWLRGAEAAALAGIFMLLQWMVVELLVAYAGSGARLSGRLPQMLVTSGIVGGAIGWFVPHLFRARGRPLAEAVTTEPGALQQAAT